MDGTDARKLPSHIEALLDQLAADGSPAALDCAERLVAAVLQLYGEGLTRVVAACQEDSGGQRLLQRLADDDLVGNLLLLHDLHPDDVGVRIQRALDRVRPYLGSHAGGIDYLGVDADGVAHLRLQGSCDGCAGSAATVHSAVERAVLDAAPEVLAVSVEGMVEPEPTPTLLQIGMRCPDGMSEAVGT